MPPKAKPKSRSRSSSKPKKSPTATRSRSQSRSRSTGRKAPPKKVQSETRRRRSPSTESDSQQSASTSRSRAVSSVTKSVTKATPSLTPTRRSTRTTTVHSTTASRSDARSPAKKASTPSRFWSKLAARVRKPNLCQCHIVQSLCVLVKLAAIPLVAFWLMLLVLTPSSAGFPTSSTIFGQSVAFGGAYWPTDWKRYLDWRVMLATQSFFVAILVLSRILPVGRKFAVVAGGKHIHYINNSPLVFITVAAVILTIQRNPDRFNGVRPSTLVLAKYPAFMTSMFLLALVVAAFLYVRKLHAKRSGNVCHLVEFFDGAEKRPELFGLDLKVVLVRLGMYALLGLVGAMAVDQTEKHGHLSPGLAFCLATVGTVCLDVILFEHTLLNSHEMHATGLGAFYLLGTIFLVPSIYSLQSAIYYKNPAASELTTAHHCDCVLMGVAALMFLVGLAVNRAAMTQKHAFRQDPHDAQFAGMATVSAATGRRLLAGGWWGLVRHPNYLGEMLMALATALPAAKSGLWCVWLYPAFIVTLMVTRAVEVERSCAAKYGAAWTRYTGLVPKRFLPRLI